MIQLPGCWVHENVVCGEDVVIGHGAMLGIFPLTTKATRRPVESRLSCARVGDRTVIGAFCALYMDAHIGAECRVGDHVTIREGCRIGARCVVGTNANVQYGCTIGNDVRIQSGAYIVGGTIIGDGSFIGPGVVMANDKQVDLDDYRDRGQTAPVIGRKVFVGVGAIILPGVTIGDGAVIAAGAVVTRDVAPSETVKGMPARAA